MADDLKLRRPQDASRISLSEDWEVRYWTQALGVSAEELTGERRLVLAGWRYALRFLDERQYAVSDKLRFARDRSPWLESGVAADGSVDLADGSMAALLPSGEAAGIARRFADLVGAGRTERLVVVSPYWDDDLAALDDLRGTLKPRRTVLLVDTKRRLFPAQAALGDAGVQVSEMYGFAKRHFTEGNTRFIHAKMIVVTSGREDHVLMGSANCTIPALGNRRRPGANEEVCLYRRLPAGRIFDELGLASRLEERHKLDVRRIPKQALAKKLPLDEADAQDPGTFELAFERIAWWPRTPALAKTLVEERGELELLDQAQAPIAAQLHLVSGSEDELIFRLVKVERRPAYARIRREDGGRSGIAIVASVEELRTNMRDRLSAKAERVIRELEFDDDEGLWILDAIHTLGVRILDAPPPQLPRASGKRDEKRPVAPAKLDYDAFMRGRHREIGKSEAERNSLIGSEVSYVRAALNRLLGMTVAKADPRPGSEDQEPDFASALDTGDEVGNSEDALERGFEHRDRPPTDEADAAFARRRREQDAHAIICAVDDLTEELGDPERALDSVDMLRVRALLTIVAVAAKPHNLPADVRPSQMQVLPCSEENNTDTWPRLMGRVLVTLFGGPNPAIKRLHFERAHDRIPDDVLEAWACCLWFSHAALTAAKSDPGCAKLEPFLDRLSVHVRAILSLSKEEASAPSFEGGSGEARSKVRRAIAAGKPKGSLSEGRPIVGVENSTLRPYSKRLIQSPGGAKWTSQRTGIQRVVCEIADIVLAAEEDSATMMLPMAELMGEREPPAAFWAVAVDGNHRLPRRADDPGLAAVERPVVDGGALRPRDGFKVDFLRIRDAERS